MGRCSRLPGRRDVRDCPGLFTNDLVDKLGPRLAYVAVRGLDHLRGGAITTLLSCTDAHFAESVCRGLREDYAGIPTHPLYLFRSFLPASHADVCPHALAVLPFRGGVGVQGDSLVCLCQHSMVVASGP